MTHIEPDNNGRQQWFLTQKKYFIKVLMHVKYVRCNTRQVEHSLCKEKFSNKNKKSKKCLSYYFKYCSQ